VCFSFEGVEHTARSPRRLHAAWSISSKRITRITAAFSTKAARLPMPSVSWRPAPAPGAHAKYRLAARTMTFPRPQGYAKRTKSP
jgi:hypothetical protein